jgi:hypothetical protein
MPGESKRWEFRTKDRRTKNNDDDEDEHEQER